MVVVVGFALIRMDYQRLVFWYDFFMVSMAGCITI